MPKTNLVTFKRELKANMSSLSADMSVETLQSFIDNAELTLVVPAIGFPLYQALMADGLNAEQAMALKLLQRVVVHQAVFEFSESGALQIDDTGITVQTGKERAPASDKKLLALRRSCRRTAYQALEVTITYLESNLSKFPEYAANPAHQRNRGRYCNTTAEFSQGFELNGNAVVFAQLRSVMRTVEENHIDPVLGAALSAELKSAISAGTLSALQEHLRFRIICALAPLVIAEAIPYRLVTVDESGLITETTKAGSDNVEQSEDGSTDRLQLMMNKLQRHGETEVAKLTAWLNTNAASFTAYQPKDLAARSQINESFTSIFFV